jgi:hypothetical protein
MAKVLNFPGAVTLIDSVVPSDFQERYNSALNRGRRVVAVESMREIFTRVVSWASKELGIILKPAEELWLVDLLAKCRNFLSADQALAELMDQAKHTRGKIKRGLLWANAGNLGLMASGGFVNRRHFNEPAYFADSAQAAYGNAADLLENPLMQELAYSDRIPFLSSIIRFIRILCCTKDPFPLYKYVKAHRQTPVEPDGPHILRGFNLELVK